MCGVLEALRRKADRAAERHDLEASLTLWEDVRTLARAVHGPGDPRVWAALSRVARALLERGGKWEAAASLAEGAIEDMGYAALAAAASGSGRAGGVSVPGPEMAFAYQTVSLALDPRRGVPDCPEGAGPLPRRSLGEALWPCPPDPETRDSGMSCGSAPEDPHKLRIRLAEAMRDFGSRSLKAYEARSLLGEALAVAGEPGYAAEARELLKSSADELSGRKWTGRMEAVDSMARYARFLAGRTGPVPILFPILDAPAKEPDLRKAMGLYRTIQRVLQVYTHTRERRLSAAMGEASALTDLGIFGKAAAILRDQCSALGEDVQESPAGLSLFFDTGETYLNSCESDPHSAWGWHARALYGRLKLLGALHRDTVRSMARLGDVTAWCGADRLKAAALRARAAETLEALGGPDSSLVPDLMARIAYDLMSLDENGMAARILVRVLPGLAANGLARSPQLPEARVMIGTALMAAGDREGARDSFTAAKELLDGGTSGTHFTEEYRAGLLNEARDGLEKIRRSEDAAAFAASVSAERRWGTVPSTFGRHAPHASESASLDCSANASLDCSESVSLDCSESVSLDCSESASPTGRNAGSWISLASFAADKAAKAAEAAKAVLAADAAVAESLAEAKKHFVQIEESRSSSNWDAISRAAAEDAARRKAREAAGISIPMRPRRGRKGYPFTRSSGRA
jgi:hypothetical protein